MTLMAEVLSWKKGPGKWQKPKHSWPSWDSPSSPWDHHKGAMVCPFTWEKLGLVWFGSVVVHPFTQDDHSVQFLVCPFTQDYHSVWPLVCPFTQDYQSLWWYIPSLRTTFCLGWQFQLFLSLEMAIDTFQVPQFLFAPAVVNRSNLWFICVGNSGSAEAGTKENQMFGLRGMVACCKQMANYK